MRRNIEKQISENLELLKQQEYIFGGVFIEKGIQKVLVCGSDNIDYKVFLSFSQENMDVSEVVEMISRALADNSITVLSKEEFSQNAGI